MASKFVVGVYIATHSLSWCSEEGALRPSHATSASITDYCTPLALSNQVKHVLRKMLIKLLDEIVTRLDKMMRKEGPSYWPTATCILFLLALSIEMLQGSAQCAADADCSSGDREAQSRVARERRAQDEQFKKALERYQFCFRKVRKLYNPVSGPFAEQHCELLQEPAARHLACRLRSLMISKGAKRKLVLSPQLHH